MEVTKERWLEAQAEERRLNDVQVQTLWEHNTRFYKNYFRYLGIELNQQNKRILEIGCADFPALFLCYNLGASYIIEPMKSPNLDALAEEIGCEIIKEPAEETEMPIVDEVWLFNVLTHVINPDTIINKSKAASKVIRFFEPIETGYNIGHPWSFTLDYFRDHFGGCVQYYPPQQNIPGFHAWQCAYGVYYV